MRRAQKNAQSLKKSLIESTQASDIIESKQSKALDSGNVCSRSGASGDSFPTSDNKFVKQTCIKYDRFYPTSFSPIAEPMTSRRKKIFSGDLDSLKSTMPTITPPPAPMPVHIA